MNAVCTVKLLNTGCCVLYTVLVFSGIIPTLLPLSMFVAQVRQSVISLQSVKGQTVSVLLPLFLSGRC